MWFYVPTITAKCYFEMQIQFWLRDFSENGIVYKEALKEVSPMGKGFAVPWGCWKGVDVYLLSTSLHLCLLDSMAVGLSVHPSIYPVLRDFFDCFTVYFKGSLWRSKLNYCSEYRFSGLYALKSAMYTWGANGFPPVKYGSGSSTTISPFPSLQSPLSEGVV